MAASALASMQSPQSTHPAIQADAELWALPDSTRVTVSPHLELLLRSIAGQIAHSGQDRTCWYVHSSTCKLHCLSLVVCSSTAEFGSR